MLVNRTQSIRGGGRGCLLLVAFLGVMACSGPKPDDAGSGSLPDGVGAFVTPTPLALDYPTRLAIAADGTMFVSDPRASAVYAYQGTKRSLQITGLDRPLGLAVYGKTLFIGQDGRDRVDAYDLDKRRFVFSLGNPGDVAMPSAISVAPDGAEIFVVDSMNHRVAVFSSDGTLLATFGEQGSGPGQLDFPIAVAVDGQRVVVADQGNHRLHIFGRDQKWQKSFGAEFTGPLSDVESLRGRFTRLQGVALSAEHILVLDSSQAFVQVFNLQGSHLGFTLPINLAETGLRLFLDLRVDASGMIWISDPDKSAWLSVPVDVKPAP